MDWLNVSQICVLELITLGINHSLTNRQVFCHPERAVDTLASLDEWLSLVGARRASRNGGDTEVKTTVIIFGPNADANLAKLAGHVGQVGRPNWPIWPAKLAGQVGQLGRPIWPAKSGHPLSSSLVHYYFPIVYLY